MPLAQESRRQEERIQSTVLSLSSALWGDRPPCSHLKGWLVRSEGSGAQGGHGRCSYVVALVTVVFAVVAVGGLQEISCRRALAFLPFLLAGRQLLGVVGG